MTIYEDQNVDYVSIESENRNPFTLTITSNVLNNTHQSKQIHYSLDYKTSGNGSWKTYSSVVDWKYRPTKKTIMQITSSTGTLYIKNFKTDGFEYVDDDSSNKYNMMNFYLSDGTYLIYGNIESLNYYGIDFETSNIDYIDYDMLEELLNEIQELKEELNSLKEKCITSENITQYATTDYVDSQINGLDIPDVDLDNYATVDYVDTKFSTVDVSDLEVDLTDYVSDDELSSKLDNYSTVEYVDNKFNSVPAPDLTDYATVDDLADYALLNDLDNYATTQYVDDKFDAVAPQDLSKFATKQYVDEEIEALNLSLDYKLERYFEGPYAELNVTKIDYPELSVDDISTWFSVNDIFSDYSFSKPELITEYHESVWESQGKDPNPVGENGAYTFNENIDTIPLKYKITVTHINPSYSEDFIITQQDDDNHRVYMPLGNSLTLENGNAQTVDLSEYIIANVHETIPPTESFVTAFDQEGLSSITLAENNTGSSRTVTIRLRDENLTVYPFTLTQPSL